MNIFEDNISKISDEMRNSFINLDIKNQYNVNNWIQCYRSNIEKIKGDYIICRVPNNSEEHCLNCDNTLDEFIKINKSKIDCIFDEGLKIYVEVECNGISNNGLLNIIDGRVYIDNNIVNDTIKSIVYNYNIYKIIEKKVNFPTVQEFISKLKENKLLYNSKITVWLDDIKTIHFYYINNEIICIEGKDDEIKGNEHKLVKYFKIGYRS